MALTRAGFQGLADKLINETFGDFRDPVVLTQQGTFDYDTQTTLPAATDNTRGIRIEYAKSQVDGSNIQVGDYLVKVLQQGLTVDVRADDVSMTFDGEEVTIENVSEDPARAVYDLQVRAK